MYALVCEPQCAFNLKSCETLEKALSRPSFCCRERKLTWGRWVPRDLQRVARTADRAKAIRCALRNLRILAHRATRTCMSAVFPGFARCGEQGRAAGSERQCFVSAATYRWPHGELARAAWPACFDRLNYSLGLVRACK